MDNNDFSTSEDVAANQIADYLGSIAHLDMPLAAKIEMVSAMLKIMGSFVDSAHGDDPIQHVHELHAGDEMRIPPVVSYGQQPLDTKASLSSAFVSPASGKRKKERS